MIKAQQQQQTHNKQLNKPIHTSIRYIQSTRTSTFGEARYTFLFSFKITCVRLYDTQYSSTKKQPLRSRALV